MVRDRQDIKSLRTAASNKYIGVYYYQATTIILARPFDPGRSRAVSSDSSHSTHHHPHPSHSPIITPLSTVVLRSLQRWTTLSSAFVGLSPVCSPPAPPWETSNGC